MSLFFFHKRGTLSVAQGGKLYTMTSGHTSFLFLLPVTQVSYSGSQGDLWNFQASHTYPRKQKGGSEGCCSTSFTLFFGKGSFSVDFCLPLTGHNWAIWLPLTVRKAQILRILPSQIWQERKVKLKELKWFPEGKFIVWHTHLLAHQSLSFILLPHCPCCSSQ